MDDLCVIRGTFAHANAIKTRSTFQIIVEVPIEAADAALKRLGGWPQPGKERSVAIALINEGTGINLKPEPRSTGSLAQQSGICCGDETFWVFLGDHYGPPVPGNNEEAAAMVRDVIGVKSRSEFDSDERAGKAWFGMFAAYQDWLTL
jgi:hypothetical protein